MTSIHAGEDENGTLQVIADSLNQELEAIWKAKNALSLSFPENTNSASGRQPEAKTDEIPF